MTSTYTVQCPKCGSGDCNSTREFLGKAITTDIGIRTVFCNACTYRKVSVIIGVREIFTETRLPGSDETELDYMYLGKEKS